MRAHTFVSLVAVALAIAVMSACGGAGASTPAAARGGAATVVRDIDGDTIVARVGNDEEHVRFIGVDTPETHKPNSPVECYGQVAADHVSQLLPPGTAIKLVRDVDARDVYGRLLAYVYRASDGLFVNLELATDGYAALLTIPPNVAHADDFATAVAKARDRNLGLWGACGGPDTPVDG